MKILTAHQPVYLPWLGLFHKIATADVFVSFNQVQYQPKDWNNRNKIKTSSGPLWLTVPVNRKGYLDKKIGDITINNNVPWGRKHWRSIEANYRKTPYFQRYADYFESIYAREWISLVELNESMLKWFLETLGIKVPVLSAGDYDFQGEKSELVLDMCRTVECDAYIFGALGKDYADEAAFLKAGITPVFQDYCHPQYPQHYGEFEPYMSILDLLFNCGPDSLDVLMSGNIDKSGLIAALTVQKN